MSGIARQPPAVTVAAVGDEEGHAVVGAFGGVDLNGVVDVVAQVDGRLLWDPGTHVPEKGCLAANSPHPRSAELSALLATPQGSVPAARGVIGCGYEVQGDG